MRGRLAAGVTGTAKGGRWSQPRSGTLERPTCSVVPGDGRRPACVANPVRLAARREAGGNPTAWGNTAWERGTGAMAGPRQAGGVTGGHGGRDQGTAQATGWSRWRLAEAGSPILTDSRRGGSGSAVRCVRVIGGAGYPPGDCANARACAVNLWRAALHRGRHRAQ